MHYNFPFKEKTSTVSQPRMEMKMLYDTLKSVNVISVRLALRDMELARTYMSRCLQIYDEMMWYGLRSKDPVQFIVEKGWGKFSSTERILLPTRLYDTGGTRLEELVYLANVTKVLRPKKIFEIGTYTGHTTSIFIMNAPSDATVVSLDLPPETEVEANKTDAYIETDINLIKNRKLARHLYELNLNSRYHQVFRPLSEYLESLAKRIPIYRVPGTSLAWASAGDVRRMAE